ncbi:MAG: glycosyltransferase [Planctomycetes bacterium]|nr:glycosyltransferase [Planctomycetota bacterium]
MASPLVSVVIPYYNGSKYLPITLDSLMFQSYSNIEIIIVDDASTVCDGKVVSEYVKKIRSDKVKYVVGYKGSNIVRKVVPRFNNKRKIRVFRHRSNQGATKTFNDGLHKARGKYVTYMSQDDIAHPEMISIMVAELEKRKIDFVYSDMWIINDSGRILREFVLPDYDFYYTFCRWYFAGVSKLFRRELLSKYGYFDESYKVSMDHELFSRFAIMDAKFFHIPKVLYSVRFHDDQRQVGQHSSANTTRLYQESIEICKRNLRWLKKQHRNP